MKCGCMEQMVDELAPIFNNLENMTGEEIKIMLLEKSKLFHKAKQEFYQLSNELYAIRDKDLCEEEKFEQIDIKADQIYEVIPGRELAENTWKDALGDNWGKLDSRSQKFLVTAFVIETTIDDADGDFAPVVIEMGRVLENEIQKKIFIDYIQTLSQRTPAASDSRRFYREIESAVQDYKKQGTYFISAIKMMKYIGDLQFRDDNSRVFRKELRRLLDRKSSNIQGLSDQENVELAIRYIDEYRNGAAHPNSAEKPNLFSKSKVQSCKTETKAVLNYFLSNVGIKTQYD